MTEAPEEPQELYRAYQERAKKRFGQHFLVDPGILEEIVGLADLRLNDPVLEIGPGCGTLSLVLLQQGARLVAVEKDRDAAHFLRSALVPYFPMELHEGDALDVSLDELLEGAPRWKVVANLPYNVGTEILFRLLESSAKIDTMVLMFQREVAKRIVADVGDDGYGVLSLMVRLFADGYLALTLKPGAFVPPPKVHSSVVVLKPLEGSRIKDEALREAFRRVVRAGFQARRKTLANGLKALGCEKALVEELLEELGLGKKVRPERVSFGEFRELTRGLLERGEL